MFFLPIIVHFYKKRITLVRTNLPMVPIARIELAADPYQGPVLPLYYTGIRKFYQINKNK